MVGSCPRSPIHEPLRYRPQHPHRGEPAPLGIAKATTTLPAAARHAVLRSLLRQGLVAEYSAPHGHLVLGWRRSDGTTTAMQITDAGRQAIGYYKSRNAVDEVELSGQTQADYETELDDDHGPMAAAGIGLTNASAQAQSELYRSA